MHPLLSRNLAKITLLGALLGCVAARAEDLKPAVMPEEVFPQLDDILQKTLTQSPSMIQKSLELVQSEANKMAAIASLYPSLGVSVSYSLNTSAVADTPSPTSKSDGIFYSLGLSQPIFHWGTIKASADAARIGLKISERSYAEAYRSLAQMVRSQYLALIVKKIALKNMIFSVKVAEASLALDEERLRGGAISPGEIIPSRVAVEEARLQRDRAEEDYNFTRNTIVRLAGLESLPDAEIPDDIPAAKLKLDEGAASAMLSKFQHGGVEYTNTALTYYWSIKQSELGYKQAKYRLFPKLSFGASIAQSNSTNAAGDVVVQTGVYSQSVSLSIGWTIFDGFATRAAKRSSMASRRMAERTLANYIQQSTEQARSQERQLAFAYRAMELANVRRELIVGAVERAQDDLKRGFGSQGAVDTITLGLNNYNLIANSNRADFLSRTAEYVSLVGTDPVLAKLPARFNAPVSIKKK